MKKLILFIICSTFFWQAACQKKPIPNKSKFTLEQQVYRGVEGITRTGPDEDYSYVPEVTVYFDHNKYDLNLDSRNKLKIFYNDIISQQPDDKFFVEGNTDTSGSNTYNMQLSQQRANEVIQYLTYLGANPSQFQLLARGELNPIADDEVNPELNRRVIVYKQVRN